MTMVHISTGMNAPASPQLLSEPAIVARLAHATLSASRTPWLPLIAHYDRIRDRIADVVEGFEDFNARVRVPGGFHLRNPARERKWRIEGGRARLIPHALSTRECDTGLLQLMTVRSHDQYNTTIYGLDDRYRGVDGERRPLFICAKDLQRLGLQAGERVDLVSVWRDGEREALDFLLVEYAFPEAAWPAIFPRPQSGAARSPRSARTHAGVKVDPGSDPAAHLSAEVSSHLLRYLSTTGLRHARTAARRVGWSASRAFPDFRGRCTQERARLFSPAYAPPQSVRPEVSKGPPALQCSRSASIPQHERVRCLHGEQGSYALPASRFPILPSPFARGNEGPGKCGNGVAGVRYLTTNGLE